MQFECTRKLGNLYQGNPRGANGYAYTIQYLRSNFQRADPRYVLHRNHNWGGVLYISDLDSRSR